ncbi:amino acid adenylation domain-containing protein [Actinokineospora sp.]|uniref:amino acid adenylation domain-containing protein n=1 Tax=Actinokineospora sp. TaxID=1872133 RepID=UPI004037BF0D
MPLNLPQAERDAFETGEAPAPHLDLLHALAFRAAGAAVRLGLFDALGDDARHADELADALGADRRGVRVLLDALVGFGYASRDEHGAYQATPAAATWLRSGTGYTTVFSFWHRILFDLWPSLEQSIVDGRPAVDFYAWLAAHPVALAEFQSLLADLADAVLPDVLAAATPPPEARRLLDIGGGHGRYAAAFCQAHPNLHATVLDLPGTLDAGRKTVAAQGLDERVAFRESDWATGELGADQDMVLLFNVLHCLDPDRARDLLRRAGTCLRPGGMVVLLEEITEVAEDAGVTGAAWVPASSLNLFHTQAGQIYSADELDSWLTEAGFVDRQRFPVPSAPTFTVLVAKAPGAPAPRRWLPTAGQRQMLLFDRLVPNSAWHNVPLHTRITGPLDVDALHRVLRRIWRDQESLRTVFDTSADEPLAVLSDTEPVLAHRDVSDLTAGERDTALAEIRDTALRAPFDVTAGPPLRATLVRLGRDEHELILVLHHIAVDGHSLTVLQREILDGYRDARAGVSAEPVRHSIAEFAQWHHDFAAQAEVVGQLDYWRGQLADAPAPVELSFAATGTSLAADHVSFELRDDLAAQVRALARAKRCTPFMVLLTAFGVLLRRYSGARELVIGTPIAGRDRPEVEDLVGYLVNMVPLRLRLAAAGTWAAALGEVREVALDAYEHSDVPFGRVVEALAPARSGERHPLFQIVFAAPPAFAGPSIVDGTTFAFDGGTSTESLFDLEAQITDDGHGLRGYFKYRTELFTAAHIDMIVDHFLYLTERMVADPDADLADLALLRPEQWHRAVVEWNRTGTDYPRESSLVDLVEGWVDRAPDAPAVRYGDRELTYRELDGTANRLAHRLRRLGVGTESKVGLCLGFGADWVVGALAVLKAGGAYVPLDPAYPADRLRFMCADADVRVAVVHHEFRDRLPDVRAVVLDRETAALAAEPASRPAVACRPDGLAYVMYTSGSTGRPKGVAVTHRNIVRLVCDTDFVDLGPGDTVAQVSNLSFDAATFELWGALLNGARLVGLPKDDLLSGGALAEHLRSHRVDVMFLTTSLARQLADEAPRTIDSLRCLIFGGEQADARMVSRLLSAAGPRLVNGYGPTETTTFALTHTWLPGDPVDPVVPIGRPIANTTAYILDAFGHPVAPGVVGELHIGGDGVARGYVGHPALTAERFIADPFGLPDGRLYRTGDLGRYRADGVIECLGRIDRQVKIRGFRVEPGEIEDCLHETGQVRQATVQVRGEGILVAYVVPTDPTASMDNLRDTLRERLPEHLVPAAVVAMEALPVNENGKLDASALPDPTHPVDSSPTAPTTPIEHTVHAIWQEVLALPTLSVHDDFFALGGHSIKAGQVMSRIRAQLGIAAPLRLIFDNPTVAALAAALPPPPKPST